MVDKSILDELKLFAQQELPTGEEAALAVASLSRFMTCFELHESLQEAIGFAAILLARHALE